MTIGGTGQHTVSGLCSFANMAPGDDPVKCQIALHNAGSIPINVVWSGFALTGDPEMANWIFVTAFSDSNGQTNVSQLVSVFDSNHDGKLSLAEIAPALANGYFSNPDGQDNHTSLFLGAGQDGWVSLELAFGAEAPNSTIGKSVGFDWSLQAQQLPKNSQP
jgi:hypothetical protein